MPPPAGRGSGWYSWLRKSELMKIHIDKNLCTGCEICVNHCPDVFMMWGMYMKADFDVAHPEKYQKAVRETAGMCPKQAISID
jgi:ferredoxin